MRKDKNEVFRIAYKSAIISGSMMIANDTLNNNLGYKPATPFGKILRNLAASAGGYYIGSKIADFSYAAIERAVDKYKEEV